MNRLLACTILTLGLAACGGQEAEPVARTEPAVVAPEATPATPADAAPAAAPAATAAAASDGETVDDVTSSVSAIAAAVAAATPAVSTPLPARWVAGQHFAPLPTAQPVSVSPGTVEVAEVFWYGCGHCFALEPRIEAWEKNGKPDYVQVVRIPVVWNEVTREDARLFYTLEALGRLADLNLAVFREIHVNHNPLTIVAGNRVNPGATEKRTREFLLANGVSAEDFGKTYRSFGVESKIRQAENLSRRYMADHTPMVVVQGKYVTDVSMAGGIEPFLELVGALAAQERGTR